MRRDREPPRRLVRRLDGEHALGERQAQRGNRQFYRVTGSI
jgi:hypothetical protein